MSLIQNLQLIFILNRAITQGYKQRLTLMQHLNIQPRDIHQPIDNTYEGQHHNTHIDQYTRALKQWQNIFPLQCINRLIAYQPTRFINLVHHRVTGIDTERTGDTAFIQSMTNINSGWTDCNTLITVDTVSITLYLLPFFQSTTRLAPIQVVGGNQ